MTETAQDLRSALEPCPFCGAALKRHEDKDGEFWMHPGFVTDGLCIMSGQGVHPRNYAAWNCRIIAAPATDEPVAIERIAQAIHESDPDAGVSWVEWVAYAEAHPDHMQSVDYVRRQARAVAAMLPTEHPTAVSLLRQYHDAQNGRNECPDCDNEGPWEHCGPCSAQIGPIIAAQINFLAHPAPAKPVDRKQKMDALWKVLREHRLESGKTAAELIGGGHDAISILVGLVDALTPAESIMSHNKMVETLRWIAENDQSGEMQYELREDGPSQAIGRGGGEIAKRAREALAGVELKGESRQGHGVTLFREIDALGGVADSEWDQGYGQALCEVLTILKKRGYSEEDDAPAAEPVGMRAALEKIAALRSPNNGDYISIAQRALYAHPPAAEPVGLRDVEGDGK